MEERTHFVVRHLIHMTPAEHRYSQVWRPRVPTAEEAARHDELARNKQMVEAVGGIYTTPSPVIYERYGDENEILMCEMLIIDDGGMRGLYWYAEQAAKWDWHINVITCCPERWTNGLPSNVEAVDKDRAAYLGAYIRNAAEAFKMGTEIKRLQSGELPAWLRG